MKLFVKRFCLWTLFAAVAFVLPGHAQDSNSLSKAAAPAGVPPDPAALMNMMIELGKPGENHKVLADMTGAWTNEVKFWMSPDTNTPPTVSNGSTTIKAAMGGRYFISEHKSMMPMPGPDGKMMDTAFSGMEVAGYDNVKKEYVSTWIDNFGTSILYFEGAYDPAAKAITYTAEEEPFPGMKSKVREVVTITDHDHHTMEYFENQGGHEMKSMEVTYTRTGP